MILLQAIVLMIALLLTVQMVCNILVRFKSMSDATGKEGAICILAAVSWALFYYLTHIS